MSRIAPAADATLRLPQARLNIRFAARSDRLACLVPGAADGAQVEEWSWRGRLPVIHRLRTDRPVDGGCQAVPVGAGRVLLTRPDGHGTDRRYQVSLLGPAGSGSTEQPVTRLTGDRLVTVPSLDPAVLAWLVTIAADRTTVSRIDSADHRVRPVLALPGRLAGFGWLTGAGDRLAANHAVGGRSFPVALDLAGQAVTPLTRPGAHVLLTSHGRGAALMVRPGPGGARLGWLDPGADQLRHPAALEQIRGEALPLTVDPTGRWLALRVTDGVRSRLLIHDDHRDEVAEVDLPPAVVRLAGWPERGLRLLCSTPDAPTVPATVDRTPQGGWRARRVDPAGPGRGVRSRHRARVERFTGAAGPVEAVVYGADPRTSRHLVIALHGGPEAAWDLGYQPMLHGLAEAGIAVVAPNQRGSTGYGAAFRSALHGAWGVPDLADIRLLAAELRRDRVDSGGALPALYGTSYGAFLALLAAAAEPDAWSHCVAVAPFLSAAALHADGPPTVRALIDRLDGQTTADDDLGPRDLNRLGARIRVPLLVVHGDRDPLIPVGHSRRLVALLRAAGRPVRYHEVAGGGHDPLLEPAGTSLATEVVAFLAGTGPNSGAEPIPAPEADRPASAARSTSDAGHNPRHRSTGGPGPAADAVDRSMSVAPAGA